MSTKARILVVGQSGVGKSSLLTRLTMETCLSDHIPTEAPEHFSSIVFYNGEPIELDIVDVPGSPDSYVDYNEFILSSDMVILLYDITSFDSFRTVDLLRQYIYTVYMTSRPETQALSASEFQKQLPLLLLGNKTDLEEHRVIQYEKGERLASLYNVPFFEISSLLPNGNTEMVLPICSQLIFEAKRHSSAHHYSLYNDPSSLVSIPSPASSSVGGSVGSKSNDPSSSSYYQRPRSVSSSLSSLSSSESKQQQQSDGESCTIM